MEYFNLYALPSLVSGLTALSIGIFVFLKTGKERLRDLFVVLSFFVALLCFIEFELRMSESPERALFWSKAYSIWSLILALSIHFGLSLNRQKENNSWLLILIYFPAILLFAVQISTFQIALVPAHNYWGWSMQYSYNIYSKLAYLLVIVYWIINTSIPFFYFRKFSGREKKQALFIFIGFAFNFVCTISTDVVLPSLGAKFPELGNSSGIIPLGLIAFAIWRYQLFEIKEDTLTGKMFANISDALFLLNSRMEVIELNNTALKLLQFSKNEVIGKGVERFIKNLDFQKFHNRSEEPSQINLFETDLVCHNNHMVPVSLSVSPVFFNKLNENGFVLIARDISEKIKQEKELHKKELLHKIIIENSDFVVYMLDRNGIFLLSEGKSLKKLHLKPGQVVGLSALELYKDYPEAVAAINKALKGELVQTKTSIENLCYRVNYTPLFDEYGRFYATIGMATDITDMSVLNRQLVELNEAKTKLFSIIGHDLKNPMGNIVNLAKLLLKNSESYDKDKKYEITQYIEQSAISASELLQNLLEWSLSIGELTLSSLKNENLFSIVDNSLNSLYSLAEKKEIKLRNHVNPALFIVCNIQAIQTVIRNLVTNAIKFTQRGGEISIDAEIAVENDVDFVKIYIKDNGIGMTINHAENIFRPNPETKSIGTEGEKGTGFGLVISKELIEKQGGTIQVKSVLNEGSTFVILIPKSQE